MQVDAHIQAYAKTLTGLFGHSSTPVWEQPLKDSLPQTFTRAQRGILIQASTQILRDRFLEVVNPRIGSFGPEFETVDEGFRHHLINAFADGVRQNLSGLNMWYTPLMQRQRQNGRIFQNLVNMQNNLEEIAGNYRLICGERITPQFGMFLSYLELEHMPELNNLISQAEAEMHFENLHQDAIAKAQKDESRTHLRRIDPDQWQHASMTRNELS